MIPEMPQLPQRRVPLSPCYVSATALPKFSLSARMLRGNDHV